MSNIDNLVRLCCLCSIVIVAITFYSNKNSSKSRRNLRGGCVLPSHPSFGWWSMMYPSNSNLVPRGTILEIQCNETYKLEGCKMTVCANGTWVPQIGKCLKTCPSMLSSGMVRVRCSYNNKIMKKCVDAVDSTKAEFTCAPFYEDERRLRTKAICRDGRWSEEIPQCVPICGRRKPVPLIVNGTTSELVEFPWQIALYKREECVCGGTLLHEKLVLTAAHCVSDKNGKPLSASIYNVVAGKFYRNYRDLRDKNAQFSSVHAIFVPENYAGLGRIYQSDLAIIVPSQAFRLSDTVLPICIDWTKEYENHFFEMAEPVGHVSGWGYTIEYDKPSEELKSLQVPIFDRERCIEMLNDTDNEGYITEDKLCAGFLNKSKSVCKGDSGSGLVFSHKSRFYIIGIVSITLRGQTENGGCDSQKYAFYTHVSKYVGDFIWEYYARFKPVRSQLLYPNQSTENSISDISTTSAPPSVTQNTTKSSKNTSCILPKPPHLGRWSVYGARKKYSPGMLVKSETFLKVECQKQYKLDGDRVVVCENGTWSSAVGKCLKFCPSLYNTRILNVTCFSKVKLERCDEPLDGTFAKYQCAPFYEDMTLMEYPPVCSNGTWSPAVPQCVPKCGQKFMEDPYFEENNSPRGDFPWVVAFYRKNDSALICTGSLITEKIALSAVACFTGKENYTMVAGKYFSKFNDSRDLPHQQYSNIQDVFFSQAQNHASGVAFIIATEMFNFSLRVQPVCIDWEQKFENDYREGFIAEESTKFLNGPKTVKIGFVSSDECTSDFEQKFCVRYQKNGTSVCPNGGGVFVKRNNKFYIVGVLDVTSKSKVNQYGFYAPIYNHMDVMSKVLKEMVSFEPKVPNL